MLIIKIGNDLALLVPWIPRSHICKPAGLQGAVIVTNLIRESGICTSSEQIYDAVRRKSMHHPQGTTKIHKTVDSNCFFAYHYSSLSYVKQ